MSIHPSLKITIPHKSKITKHAAPYWDLVRTHTKSRRSMVNFITDIGGYSSRWSQFAIEFNIKADGADFDADRLWAQVVESKEFTWADEEQAKALFYAAREEHDNELWNWAIEEAYENWSDSDTPYATFTGDSVDWSWVVEGRSGGHLCLTECEGINLKVSPEELEENLMERAEPFGPFEISNEAVRKLFIICVQLTVEMTAKNISAEVERAAWWRLMSTFVETELDRIEAAKPERAKMAAGIKSLRGIIDGLRTPDENDELDRARNALEKLITIYEGTLK